MGITTSRRLAVSFRWEYEKKCFITQALVIQSFRDTPIFGDEKTGHSEVLVTTVRPTISDGSHISARWNRITVGGTWERIAFREGIEWKGGRPHSHSSLTTYIRNSVCAHPWTHRVARRDSDSSQELTTRAQAAVQSRFQPQSFPADHTCAAPCNTALCRRRKPIGVLSFPGDAPAI